MYFTVQVELGTVRYSADIFVESHIPDWDWLFTFVVSDKLPRLFTIAEQVMNQGSLTNANRCKESSGYCTLNNSSFSWIGCCVMIAVFVTLGRRGVTCLRHSGQNRYSILFI